MLTDALHKNILSVTGCVTRTETNIYGSNYPVRQFCNTANNNTCEDCPPGFLQFAPDGHNELTCLECTDEYVCGGKYDSCDYLYIKAAKISLDH